YAAAGYRAPDHHRAADHPSRGGGPASEPVDCGPCAGHQGDDTRTRAHGGAIALGGGFALPDVRMGLGPHGTAHHASEPRTPARRGAVAGGASLIAISVRTG